MIKKHIYIEAQPAQELDSVEKSGYTGYFDCFNHGNYFAAHDALEALWLEEKTGADHGFYKGLIQGAAAFVHLQKNYAQPSHPVHSRRLEPAARLFSRCLFHLGPYPLFHKALDLNGARSIFQCYLEALLASQCRVNPWQPCTLPQLHLSR